MNAESIMALCIVCFVALIFVVLGICQYKSREPVGFYTGEKPPKEEELTDVKAWNKGHGILWGGYGVLMILAGCSAICLRNEILGAGITFMIIISGLIGIIVGHRLLVKKYMIKR